MFLICLFISSVPIPPFWFLTHFSYTRNLVDDGKYCLTGGYDRTIKLWNPFRIDPAYVTTSTSSNSSLPPSLLIQNYTSGYTHPISALTTNETSTETQVLIAACDKSLIVSDMVTNRVLRRFGQGHHFGRINAVTTSNQSNLIISASYDGTVALWDGKSRDVKPIQIFKDAKDSVTDVHVANSNENDGCGSDSSHTIIHTSSVDGYVRSYDMRRGIMKCDNFNAPTTSMAPTKDGQCLAVNCLDSTIRLMELESGELLNIYSGSHRGGNYQLETSILANDSMIATASEDGYCTFYDLVTSKCVSHLNTSSSSSMLSASISSNSSSSSYYCCSIACHPKQSSIMVTSNYDGTTQVWSNEMNSTKWQNQITTTSS